MQDNTVETSTSLSQLLRESYLADSRVHQRHSEMSRSDATSRRLVYGTLTGKSDETGRQDDLPDLSAFLSQEELDKSVNLARQAIGHDPQEERAEEKPPGVHCVVPKIKPMSEKNEEPPSHPLSPDRQTFQAAHKDNLTKNNKSSKEPIQDFRKPPRNNPYGPETQSKKEFLNKAADFIEELSSLFKANSSKRVRPRSCKAHRSRYQTKPDGPVFNLDSGDRERANPHFTGQLDVQTDADFEESSLGLQKESSVEEPCETGETENYETKAPAPPQQAEEPLMEPPRFIQKLKSREVPEGSKVQLDCIVRGLPIPDVRWFCEGKELENSPDIQIINNGELHSLIIAEAFEEDTGRYSCFASNFYGTDSTSAEIYIEGASSSDSEADQHFEHVAQSQKKALLSASVLPLVPRIRPVCEEDNISALPHSCLLGEQLPVQEVPTSLSAHVVTAPISVQEVPIQLSAQVVAAQLPVQEVPTQLSAQVVAAQLPVQEVSKPSSAPVVTAQLPVQEVSTPLLAPVITTQILAQESQNASVYPQGLDGRPIMAAPVFTKSLQDLVAFEGQLVVLECRVKGVPSPLVDWYREGSMIDDSPDFRILQKKPRSMAESEEICTLVIAEVFPEDSGVFTCTACNKYGTVSSIASLKVKGNEKSSINTKARTALTVESSQHMAPELISPDLTGSNSKSRLYGDLANSSKPQLSILTPDHLSPGVKLGTEGTLLPHNESLSSLLPSDPFNLRSSQEGPRLHHHDPRSSTLPPDSFSSSLMPTLEGTLVNQMEGSLINQNQPQSGAMPLDNSVCLKPNLETPLLNHNQPSYTGSPPDAPSSCLKPKLVNHKEPRSNSRVGLRVHFKLPEDEVESEESSEESLSALEMANNLPHGDMLLSLPNKEPPPILAKPKLDPVQLQLLHNQVLLEQQQDGAPQSQLEPTPWSPTPYHEPKSGPMNTSNSAYMPLPPTAPATSTNMTQSFNYTRPKEFISAQTQSPVRSLSPTESPVPMLHAMAAQVQQKPAVESSFPSFPTAGPQFPQAPRMFPTRVLQSPTSPPHFVSSPTHVSPAFLNSQFVLRPQSPTQASSPTPSSSTPSPIQNPVAFLSSVLPSLPTTPQTNAMGLPKSAPLVSPQGILKKMPKPFRPVTDEDIRDTREIILHDLDKKLRFKEDSARNGQQKLTYEGKTAGRLLGPNNPATVFNYDDVQECPPFQEYKVSNFEQRLMSEIEFRLERTPVEESDDEVQHDEIPTGKCIAPIFDKKLKNFRVMEGVPVTFTCKVVGIPIPKVYWFKDGKQILKKNEHYKKIRERDGTCALHIEAATNDDDGNYTVMAANPQGRNSCSGHLIVQTGPVRGRLTPMIHSQRVRSRVQEVEEGEPIQERFFRPHFLQAPGDMASHEGRLCRLDCKVSGLPNPDLMWLLNGKPILPDFYHRMLVRENGIHSLLIDPLKQSDAGTYTCIATNKAGQNSFSLELSVMEKEVKKAPLLVERLQNTGIAEGAPVRLECRVVGMPPPVIYWKKDNETIPPNKERVSMHQDTTGYVCLVIQPTRKEDAGWYTVSAKNEAGIVSCTARLDIYAQWHQQIPQPMKKVRPTSSRYAALTDQGLDIMSAFPTMDNSPILFASSPVEAALESEEL